MKRIESIHYVDFMDFADDCKCGNVYPLSIVQSYQRGEIFAKQAIDCKAALFWHYCGFAFVSGKYDEVFHP
ncbi:MAG: hypothetical protein LUI12_05440 [Clostridiales bacterium]|nr:hypothetical protein [Clostridiales bacterium]